MAHFLNNSGFTTSLELEVRLFDVRHETEDNERCSYLICLFCKGKLTKMAPPTKPEGVLTMFHCPLCQHATHAYTSRYITDATKEHYHQCQDINCSTTFIIYESVQRYIVKPGEVHVVKPHPLPSGQQVMWM